MLANLLTRKFVEVRERTWDLCEGKRPQLLPLKVKQLIYHPTVQQISSML